MLKLKGIKIDSKTIAVKSTDIKPLGKNEKFDLVVDDITYHCEVTQKEKKFFEITPNSNFFYYSFRFNCLSHDIVVTEYSNI